MENGLIASALLTMDQSSFQELMADFLNARGYKLIGKPGGVAGKNKTKRGTPDVFFVDNHDKYAYCECTTRERLPKGNEFLKKLLSDIAHCFSESPKSVPRDRISCVILCCTGEILPNEDLLLRERVQGYQLGCKLELYTIGNLPTLLSKEHLLLEKYFPHFARTKGIVLELQEFLKRGERRIQPWHNGPFVGRKEDILKVTEALEVHDLLLLSGTQGVGKSRLAIQVMVGFQEEGFIPLVIEGTTVSIWDDLPRLFSPERKYVVLFDDANKGLENLEGLLRFIESAPISSIKVIITVREYLRPVVQQRLHDWKTASLKLEPIEELELSNLVQENIPKGWSLNQMGIRQIVTLSKGNPRIALMALHSMFESGGKGVFESVFSIYESYFKRISHEVSFLADRKKLTALGVLSFFENIDRLDRNKRTFLEPQIDISWEELWVTYGELDAMELVDLNEDRDVVRISDPVLATFSFYKSFLDTSTSVIDYRHWLEQALRFYPEKVKVSIADCIHTFGYQPLMQVVKTHTSKLSDLVSSQLEFAFHFYDAFWFYHQMEALRFVSDQIDGLEDSEERSWGSSYGWEYGIGEGRILTLLGYFWESDSLLQGEAIQLGLSLCRPNIATALQRKLMDCFNFTHDDCNRGYPRHLKLVEIFSLEVVDEARRDAIDAVFLNSTEKFFEWESRMVRRSSVGKSYLMNTFTKSPIAELTQFRIATLRNLFRIAASKPAEVFERMEVYVQHALNDGQCPAKAEIEMVAAFLFQFLDRTNYTHDQLVQKFKELTKGMSPNLFNDWKGFEKLELAALIHAFRELREEAMVSGPQPEDASFDTFRGFVAGLSITEITRLCDQIERESQRGNVDWDMQLSFKYFLDVLVVNDLGKYLALMEHAIACDYQMHFTKGSVVTLPLALGLIDAQEYYDFLVGKQYANRDYWTLLFFDALPDNAINEFLFQAFVAHFLGLETDWYVSDCSSLVKFDLYYQKWRPEIPSLETPIESLFLSLLQSLWGKRERMKLVLGRQFCEKYHAYFLNDIPLLKSIYLYQKKTQADYDRLGTEWRAVCELDHRFVIEGLRNMISEESQTYVPMHGMKVDFIWDWIDSEAILDGVMDVCLQNELWTFMFEHRGALFFKGVASDPSRSERAWRYLVSRVAKFSTSIPHLGCFMSIVVFTFPDREIAMLREMLLVNQDVEMLCKLNLFKSDGFESGSFVPGVAMKIKRLNEAMEMLKTLPNPLKYTAHEAYLQGEIEEKEKDRKRELRRDFKEGE